MKKIRLLVILVTGMLTILTGCKKSNEENLNNANPNLTEKYLKRLEIISADPEENKTIVINYDSQNRVSSISDGTSSSFLSYATDESLATVTDDGEPMDVDDLYQSPYDAFENGKVLEYDSNGNPKIIEVYDYDFKSEQLTGEITYDPNPNPFFYTLKAAKIIDVLDRVELDFGPQTPDIIKARKLLPYNNVSGMIFKDINGNTKSEVHIDYTYSSDKYPVSATVIAISEDGTSQYSVNYYYK